MKVDLSKCKIGDKLLSKHGMVLEYVGVLPEDDFYDHEVKYPDGSPGTRLNNGMVYKNYSLPADHDIIEIINSCSIRYSQKVYQRYKIT